MAIKFILFICCLFFLNIICASSLTISPEQISFIGKTNQEICNEISIKLDSEQTLIGEDKWAEPGFSLRKLSQHNNDASELGIEINYPSILKVTNKETVSVCINGKQSGNFHGALLYRIDGEPVRVGIWMNVNLTRNGIIPQSITGSVINENNFSNVFIISSVTLMILLIGLIFILYRKNNI